MISGKNKTYVIAEAGVNHNGSQKLAKLLIKKAKSAGANCIKFQLYKSDLLVTKSSKLAEYQRKNSKNETSQYELISKYELSKKFLTNLINFSIQKKIDFMVSIFDEQSLDLINLLDYNNFIKIPSGEITNYFLLKKINLKKNKVIISTGMSNYKEIVNAINVVSGKIIYRLKNNKIFIKNQKFLNKIKKKIILMHCITDYPAKFEYSNLRVINKMKNDFQLEVGFSDHSKSTEVSVASIYAGANIIEKHFTLNKNLKGPDHIASLDPNELRILIRKINFANEILGSNRKKMQICEKKNINLVRKYLVAKREIKKNDKFTLSNLTAKRSLKGISPMKVTEILNKKSNKNYKIDELIKK